MSRACARGVAAVYKFATKWECEQLMRCRDGFKAKGDANFVHLSTKRQLLPSFLRKHAIADAKNFNIISVRARRVVWEEAKNGEVYPHLYGSLFPEVLWVRDMNEVLHEWRMHKS